MLGCLDEDQFAALKDGKLSPADRRDALGHIKHCPPCMQVWIALGGPAQEPTPDPEGPPDLIGLTVAGFTVEREIGHGAMGVVYEAVHPQIRQRAAVKVLS